MTELLVCVMILIPVMGAAVSLFRIGANEQATEQGSIDVVQEARAGLELMTTEIAQAGSHRDKVTTTTGAVGSGAQSVGVQSAAGFTAGDWVDIDPSNPETVQLTSVGTNSISANFDSSHDSGVTVCLFAKPYVQGVIPPSGMGANASTNVTTIRFFGDISGNTNSSSGDPNLHYVEYVYDSNNNTITRSATPLTQSTKNAPVALIRNIKPNSAQFTLNTNRLGVVTSANIAVTVQNTVRTGSSRQEMQLASRILIPSAVAASNLVEEMQYYHAIDHIPPTPSNVATLMATSE